MSNLKQLFKMKRRLEYWSYKLGHSYKCETKLMDHSENPDTIGVIIENWSTWKGDFRLSDGQFIGEGRELDGPGMPVHVLYRRMVRQLKRHAEYIKLHSEARENNCLVFDGKLVAVENVDVQDRFFDCQPVFKIINADGSYSTWYGYSAEKALENASPWLRDKTPALIQLKSLGGAK